MKLVHELLNIKSNISLASVYITKLRFMEYCIRKQDIFCYYLLCQKGDRIDPFKMLFALTNKQKNCLFCYLESMRALHVKDHMKAFLVAGANL